MANLRVADELKSGPENLSESVLKLVNLLALLLVQGRTQAEQSVLLNRAGFRHAEIAALLGTTSNTVKSELSQQKHKKKRKQA